MASCGEPEHNIERLHAQTQLTHALSAAGDCTEAVHIGREALATAQRFYGPEHPETLGAMGALARAYCCSGDYAASVPLRMEGLEVRRRKLGADHELTLMAAMNLGTSYMQIGRHEEALVLLTEAADGMRNKQNHQSTFFSYLSNLACLHSVRPIQTSCCFVAN